MQIDITNLSMSYSPNAKALKDISISLKSPNLIGLLGPNGAGKSTLLKLLTAGLFPTSGKISIDGTEIGKCEKTLKSKLGYLPQSFGLYEELTVWQFLDYMASLKGIDNRRAAIDAAILAANLEEKRKAKIRTISGGQRQRVGIAQAVLGSPEFLIFDEPTVGLDPEERVHFRNYFSETAQDKLVLLSTHIIEDVQSVCNHLIVISRGKILFAGTPEELIKSARGHVGVFTESETSRKTAGLTVTARMNTAEGIACRAVADTLPDYARSAEPTLEDAYMYLIAGEGNVK